VPATADVTVLILHPEPGPEAGPLVRAVGAARAALAERHATGFRAAGASDVRVIAGPPDDTPFGRRLRGLVRDIGPGGLVVLGSGAIPLATAADRRAFVTAASGGVANGAAPHALANNRYSADIVAIPRAASVLGELPDALPSDNALPRWLAEIAGLPVDDLRRRWRLAIDIDGPLELVLLGGASSRFLSDADQATVERQLSRVRAIAADPSAELVVAGRTSAASIAWLERTTRARTRALAEERGLRTSVPGQRPPASVVGLLLDHAGPGSLGTHLARLGDAAVVDTRVLLAHHLGPAERDWPDAEDRFASDLLLPERIADPWLRELTAAAVTAEIPVLLGGHTLVGPGLRLALRPPA
jgi:hypothetical protein